MDRRWELLPETQQKNIPPPTPPFLLSKIKKREFSDCQQKFKLLRTKCVHPREQDQELLRGSSEPWSGANISRGLGAAGGDGGAAAVPHHGIPQLLVLVWDTDSNSRPEQEMKPFLCSRGERGLAEPPCQHSVGLAAVELELWCPRGPYQGHGVTPKNWGKTCNYVPLMFFLLKGCEGKVVFTSFHVTLVFFESCFSTCILFGVTGTQWQPSPCKSSPAGISDTESPGRGTVIVKHLPRPDFLQTCMCLPFQGGVWVPCHCWERAMGIISVFALARSAVS